MRRIFLAGFGYGISIFVGVTITFIAFACMSSDFWYDFKGVMILYSFSLLIAGLGGFPLFILAAIIQVIRKIRWPYYWLTCGLLAASVANILFTFLLLPFTPTLDPLVFFHTSLCGLIVGFVYSLFDPQIRFRNGNETVMYHA